MFSKLIKNLFKETTNIRDISPITFNASGNYDARYGKQHVSISGKAQDGSFSAGYNFDNTYYVTNADYNNPISHPYTDTETVIADTLTRGGTAWTYTAEDRDTYVANATQTSYNRAALVTIVQGYAYSLGNASTTGYFHKQYISPRAFDDGSTPYTYYSPTGTYWYLYSAQIRPTGIPVYYTAYSYNAAVPPGWYSGTYYFPTYPTNGDYDISSVTSNAVSGMNTPNVYGVWNLEYQNTYYSVWITYGWTQLGVATGNYTTTTIPGTTGTYNPVTNTGSSTNVLGISFPGGVGTTASYIPSTTVQPSILPKYRNSTSVTVPSGGYVTITFKI
jgi:hypothetical protein